MGKTPKKAAPGGDERNLYVRRLKATTASSKASGTSLPERQRESDCTKRAKPTGIQRKIPPSTVKPFQSKLPSSSKLSLSHPPKRVGRPVGSTNKKKLIVSVKPLELQGSSMQPESVETEVNPEVTNKSEDTKEECAVKTNNETVDGPAEKKEVKNGVEERQPSPTEEHALPLEKHREQTSEEVQKTELEMIEASLQESPANENCETEEREEYGSALSLKVDEIQDCVAEKESTEEAKMEEPQELTNGNTEKVSEKDTEKEVEKEVEKEEQRGEQQHETQTDTESCSVEIVESTASEVSETSECYPSQQEPKDKLEPSNVDDDSFVSYDTNILLKDVQIKLNDCLKDNSKLFDVSNAGTSSPMRELSFGKTLRNISGRQSLSRMRNVTVRERRFSPDSSMFVNTSSVSLNPDDGLDAKILRYRSRVDDASSTNGSPVPERKRKLDPESSLYSAKKTKTEPVENSSPLNVSFGLLRGFRKPVQVSTPNVLPRKFPSGNLDVSGLGEDTVNGQHGDGTRKWCVVM